MRVYGLVLTMLLAGCSGAHLSDNTIKVEAVESFEAEKYLGKWYEIARYPFIAEQDCYATTAEYELLEEKNDKKEVTEKQKEEGKKEDSVEKPLEISVTNRCHLGGVDGPVRESIGKARVEGPGQLNVTFGPIYFSNEPNYWVLGHKNYKISVVGEPSRRTGWILARKPKISEIDLNWARSILRANGYSTENLIITEH